MNNYDVHVRVSNGPGGPTLTFTNADGTVDRTNVSVSTTDAVQWVAHDGDLHMIWQNGRHPFRAEPAPVPSGAAGAPNPVKSSAQGGYKYTARITRPGMPPVSVDPRISVDSASGGRKGRLLARWAWWSGSRWRLSLCHN